MPLKACDLALRGSARLLRSDKARLTILGDGPERDRLEMLSKQLLIRDRVNFIGWVNHAEVLTRLKRADVLVFPSLRDFGAAVVFEALAKGVVPVVVDQGGPGDIVRDDVGYRINLGNEALMVEEIEVALERLASDREHLVRLRRDGLAYAREELTWERKAGMITEVLFWVTGLGPKPIVVPPKIL